MPEQKPKPNKETIRHHLAHITRRWSELEEACLLEIVHLSAEDRAQVKQVSHYTPDEIGLDMAADDIEGFNALKINSYATVNPVSATNRPKAGRRASAEHIVASFFHFADADSKQAADNIRAFVGPKATFQVVTGTQPCIRPHVYWELEEPTRNLQAWSATQSAISDTLATDRVIDPPRIMRIGGTINWPKPQKSAKGYIPEVTSLMIHDSDERPPVTSERMARAFANAAPASASVGSIQIATGPQSLDRERVRIQALNGEEWHNAVIRLVASYVSKGLSDEEIHGLTAPLTLDGYTAEDTARDVQKAIDGARAKGWAPEPAQNPFQIETGPAVETAPVQFPTLFDDFDASTITPRQWIYANHYLRGFVSVLASAGGIGKTSLQIVEALSIATGRPLLGEQVKEPVPVWIINLEDPLDEMKRRILAAMQHYHVTADEVRGKLFVDAGRDFAMTFAAQTRDGIIPNDALVAHLKDKIPERGIGCVFLDPFVGAHEVNENDNMAVNSVVAQIREIADVTNCAFGLVHHTRKGNGEDANIDSVRGAGSLIGAARAARVINRISERDATSLGIDLAEAKSIFRIDDGKANLAPPAQKALYRKMEGVKIANGEWVGVAVPFELPDEWAGMSEGVVNEILALIDKGQSETGDEEYFSGRPQDKARWVGKVIMDYPFPRAEDFKTEAQAKAIIKTWLQSGLIEEVEFYSQAQRKNRRGIISTGRVGESR